MVTYQESRHKYVTWSLAGQLSTLLIAACHESGVSGDTLLATGMAR
jgi:hypothetical protein